MLTHSSHQTPPRHCYTTRPSGWRAILLLVAFLCCSCPAGAQLPPNKFVGILYENWFNRYNTHQYVYPSFPPTIGGVLWWGQPLAGFYSSSDTAVINSHADQLVAAG